MLRACSVSRIFDYYYCCFSSNSIQIAAKISSNFWCHFLDKWHTDSMDSFYSSKCYCWCCWSMLCVSNVRVFIYCNYSASIHRIVICAVRGHRCWCHVPPAIHKIVHPSEFDTIFVCGVCVCARSLLCAHKSQKQNAFTFFLFRSMINKRNTCNFSRFNFNARIHPQKHTKF